MQNAKDEMAGTRLAVGVGGRRDGRFGVNVRFDRGVSVGATTRATARDGGTRLATPAA